MAARRVAGWRIWKAWLPIVASFASLLLVVGAVRYRRPFVPPLPGSDVQGQRGVVADMCSWDGAWYTGIARDGYNFVPNVQCNVVYFPAYPLLARYISVIFGLSTELSLLVTANVFLIGAMFLLQHYLASSERLERDRRCQFYTLLAFAVFPTTFFFRMGYTEAMLVFLLIAAMLGMRQHWHPLLVAIIIGLATATRSVGIALLFPFAIFLWATTSERHELWILSPVASRVTMWSWRCLLLFPVACWGVLAFMLYQRIALGSALAFVHAQQMWHIRVSPSSPLGTFASWVSGEPLWSTYLPWSPCYWAHEQPVTERFLNLEFANPIYFALSIALTLYGIKKRWLSAQEVSLCIGLLGIPYLLQTGRQGMISEARFAAVVFPVYIVIGQILSKSHWVVATYVLLCGAGLLATYSMLFASGYSFF